MKKLLAVLLSLTFAASLRASIPPAENLLPSDTLFFLTIPDCAVLRTAAHQSPQWLFWSDPAMKPFHDKFMAKLDESLAAPLEQSLGLKMSDFADLPQGQLTFAVTQNGWTGGDDASPGIVLLLDTKDKSDLLTTNLAALKKKWAEDGKAIRTEDIRGISFSVVTLSSNDFPSLAGILPQRQPVQELGVVSKPEKAAEIAVGQFESLLIVGNSVKAVEPISAHLSGSLLPALNDDAVFSADKLSQFRDGPLYYGWLNAKTLFYVLAHAPQATPNPQVPSPFAAAPPLDKILDATGLTGVKSASFAYRETREGSLVNFFVAAPDSDRKGLLKIFAAAHESAVPQSFVPTDAVKFWRWRLDGQEGWDALEKMAGEISPMAVAGIDAAIGMANANAQKKDPDFDLRKNLIGNLGNDFINYQKAPTGTALADLNNAPSLFLVGVEKGEPAAIAIKDLLSLSISQRQKAPDPRDFQGHKIYTLPLPGPRVPGTATTERMLYISSSSGYVALSTDISTLEEYLRSGEKPPKPLSGTPGLVDAAQHVGGTGGGLFGYQNQGEVLHVLFKTLKNQVSNNGGAGMNHMAALPKQIQDWLDFSLLPDYDQVSKYFYFSVYAGSTTADGLSFKVFAPRPPQMN